MSEKVKIRFDRVSKVFRTESGKTEALQDIGLNVVDGEFLCILGPSGCGKTTLLNILAGLLKSSGGTTLIDGQRVEGPGDNRAYVFQEYALFPCMTVLDNVAFGIESRGAPREKRRARSLCRDNILSRPAADPPCIFTCVWNLVVFFFWIRRKNPVGPYERVQACPPNESIGGRGPQSEKTPVARIAPHSAGSGRRW